MVTLVTLSVTSQEAKGAKSIAEFLPQIAKFLTTYDVAMVPDMISMVRSKDFQKEFMPQENAKWLFKQLGVMEPSPSMMRFMPKSSLLLPKLSSFLVSSVDPLTELLEALLDDYVNLDDKTKKELHNLNSLYGPMRSRKM